MKNRYGNVFADFTTLMVYRHRILQDIRIELNINKLRRILKVVMPCQMITANFEGTMLVCYCANFVPVRRDENNHMNTERIHPTQVSSTANRAHTNDD